MFAKVVADLLCECFCFYFFFLRAGDIDTIRLVFFAAVCVNRFVCVDHGSNAHKFAFVSSHMYSLNAFVPGQTPNQINQISVFVSTLSCVYLIGVNNGEQHRRQLAHVLRR